MKDSIALMMGVLGTGGAEIAQKTTDLIQPTDEQALISSAISMFTGLLAMLLNRYLNKLARKKIGRTK